MVVSGEPPAFAAEAVDVLLGRAGFGGPAGVGPAPWDVDANEIPEPWRTLLVQPAFVSDALAKQYGRAIELHLMNTGGRPHEPVYSRKVFMTAVTDDIVLAYGVAKVQTDHLPVEVVRRLQQGVHPLGVLLAQHGVPHRVEPRWYFRLNRGASLLTWYGTRRPAPIFGRICSVECDGRPAAELLDVVTGDEPLPRPVRSA